MKDDFFRPHPGLRLTDCASGFDSATVTLLVSEVKSAVESFPFARSSAIALRGQMKRLEAKSDSTGADTDAPPFDELNNFFENHFF